MKSNRSLALLLLICFGLPVLSGCGEREAVVVSGETNLSPEDYAEEEAGVGGIEEEEEY